MADYWNQALAQRMSRRRGMTVVGAGALGAAFLAACGGGSDSGSSSGGGGKQQVSSLLTKPTDQTKDAKRGGTLKRNVSSDVPNLDPMQNLAPAVPFTETVMGRLLGFKPGNLTNAQEDGVDGDAAMSWEESPDHLTITMKLRPGVKWHNIAPVNGREMDVDDVVYTWKRFSTVGNQRSGVANVANPNAPVLSLTAADKNTIVIKLKEPVTYALSMFGARENVNLMPKESESGYDPRGQMIGTGPYYISNYVRSAGFTLKRHDFWNKDLAFPDQIDYPIVSEYAAQAAQFRAGNLWIAPGAGAGGGTPTAAGFPIKQEDVLPMKKDVPDLLLYDGGYTANGNKLIFGWKTAALKDKRVRQAMSMSYDRDLWMEVWNNISKYEAEGIPVNKRYMSPLPQIGESYDGWRLEPSDEKAFGPNAKYFKHDVAEAKKLMAAAGFASGLTLKAHIVKGTDYGVNFQKEVEMRAGMNADIGIKFENELIDYQTEFIPQYRDTSGNWEGVGYRSGPPATSGTPIGQYSFFYSSKAGISFIGHPDGSDSKVDDLIKRGQQEYDTEKRKTIVKDLEQYLGEQMYCVMGLAGASGFSLVWPAVANYRVWRGGTANAYRTENTYLWVDPTKAPVK